MDDCDEIPFIEESSDIATLRMHIETQQDIGEQPRHINMGMDALIRTLHKMYGHTMCSTLINRSTIVTEVAVFCSALRDVIKDANWAKSTGRHCLRIIKKILSKTAIDPNFISRMSITDSNVRSKSDPSHYLPTRYQKMEQTHPTRELIGKWVTKIKSKTKNKSPASLRAIMYFLLNECLPRMNLDAETFSDSNIPSLTPQLVQDLCDRNAKKARWLRMFYTHLFEKDFDSALFNGITESKTPTDDDGSDKHRISAEELDLIYEEARKDTFDELTFMLMATTGMRIGGLACILLKDVADIHKQDVSVKTSGKTLEKGSKWFQFLLTSRVRELLFVWIQSHRPAINSPFLFPGRGKTGHLTPAHIRKRFKDVCWRAGLDGPHLHPHSLRHSYAHILLETGNDVHTISKLLGHASTAITEAFYLKESAAQVASRANIPWLDKSQASSNPVPQFLSACKPPPTTEQKNRKRSIAKLVRFKEERQTSQPNE